MDDINWRDIDEDRSLFEPENKHRKILAYTHCIIRIDWAEYVNPSTNVLKTCKEKVIKYAYLD